MCNIYMYICHKEIEHFFQATWPKMLLPKRSFPNIQPLFNVLVHLSILFFTFYIFWQNLIFKLFSSQYIFILILYT